MNNVNLMGRLTHDPELKQTNNGTSVLSCSIAVNSTTKNEDGSYKADFINIQAWKHTAEFISKYFTKGSMIGITGRISTRIYQDKDTGKNRTAFEVVANQVYFAGGEKKQGNNTKPTTPTIDFTDIANDDGDLPF